MRLRPVLTILIISATILSACGIDSPLSDGPGPLPDRTGPLANNQGNEAFNAEDFGAALEAYAQADQRMPERPEPEYNSGNALYRMDSLEEARAQYQGALVRADDEQISRNSVFNIGNILFTSGQYAEAVEAYKEALRIDSTDLDAKYNLELALQQLQQQEQEQETESQPGETDPDQDEQQQDQGQQPENEPSDQEDEQQQGQENPPEEPQQGESENDSEEESQPVPTEGLTEEQARQLLQSVGENADTLQSRIQQVLVVTGPGPERNW